MNVNQIKLGAIISYLALFTNVIIGLVYTPWLIKTIGKSDYGLYTLAMSIIGLVAFDFGLGNATTKFITQYLAEGRQDKVDNLLGLVYKLYLLVDVVIFIILFVVYLNLPSIYKGLTTDELGRFSIVFAIAATYCVLSFPFIPINGVLTSYEKFVQLKTCDLAYRLIIVFTMTGCLLLGFGLYALVLVNSAAGIINILAKLIVIKRATPLRVNLLFWSKSELVTIFKFVLWVTIAALAQRLIFNISPSILGIFSDSQAIAILGVAITLESYTFMFANALNGMFLPKVSRMVVNNTVDEILELMTKIGRIQIYIIGYICIWLIAFGRHFISVWMGEQYLLVYPCGLLIILPSFFQLPQEIGLTYIIATNKVKLQAYINVLMGIVNVCLSIPLTLKWGVMGMCISIFVAYMIRTICLDVVLKRVLNLNVLLFFKGSFLKLAPCLFISLLLSISCNLIMEDRGWLDLLLKSFFSIVLYAAIVYYLGFNSFEKKTFIEPIKQLTTHH